MSERPETYGRGLYLAALSFFSVLSVVGNAVYAYRAAPATVDGALPPGWAAAAHVVPPVALLLVTEVVAAATTRLPAGRARWVGLGGAGIIAAAAFALSFDALYAVAEMAKVRAELAWLVPVMLDVAIVVCTVLVLTASDRVRADRAALVHLVEPVDRPYDPVDRPDEHWSIEAVDQVDEHAVRPAVQASDEPIGRAVRTLDDEPVDQRSTGPDQPVRVDELVSDHAVDRVSDVLSEPSGRPVVRPDELVSDHAVDQVSDVLSELDDQPVDRPDEMLSDRPSDGVDDEVSENPVDRSTDWLEVAERVRSVTGLTADVDDLARVLAMDAAGASRREIAEAVGRAKSTVSGWIAKAGDVHRPALASVD